MPEELFALSNNSLIHIVQNIIQYFLAKSIFPGFEIDAL